MVASSRVYSTPQRGLSQWVAITILYAAAFWSKSSAGARKLITLGAQFTDCTAPLNALMFVAMK